MANWLGKILNIRTGEWGRLLSISFLLVISALGTVWAQSATYATFVKEVGQSAIIWVQTFSSILSIPFMFIYAAYVDRVDNNRLFIYIVALGAALKLFSLALTSVISPAWAFLFLYILAVVWLAAWNAQFATYVNELFDIQAGKRAWPIILAAASLASILGGFTLQYLMRRLSASALVGFWLFADLAGIGALLLTKRLVKSKKIAPPEIKKEEQGGWPRGTKEGFAFTVESGLLRWIALGTLVMMALMGLMEYYYNDILSRQFENPAAYAGFLGMLEGISGAVGLAILFFGIGWLTRVWGVKNANLVFPALNFLICVGLAGVPFAHAAALYVGSLAFISRSGLRSGLQEPIDALLFNAVPLRIRGRARAFVGGIVTPVGTLASALLLWLLSGSNLAVRGAILLLAAVYVVGAFLIRREYTQALVRMLEEEDYSFLLASEAAKLNIADPASLGRLRAKLEESATHEMRVFMTQLIAQVGGADALPILVPAVKAAAEGRTRAAMLEVMSAAGLHGPKMRALCESLLADPDPQARLAALAGLEQLLGTQDRWLQLQWVKTTDDPAPQVSLYALQSLAATGDFYKFPQAAEKLEALLRGDSEQKKSAIDILGVIAQPAAIERLLAFLNDASQQIRLQAALNLEKLALPLGNALDEKIFENALPLLDDPLTSVRQAALRIVGKFKNQQAYERLVSALADKNPQVAASSADILTQLGAAALPFVQKEISSPNFRARKMAAVVLSRVAPRQFGSLIEKSVSDNLNLIYQNISLEEALTPYASYRSVRLQLAALRENNSRLIDEILYLLSALHPRQILDVIGESIRSDSAETRNLALEALESLTSPKTAALIASLFEPSLAPAQLLQMGRGTLNVEEFSAPQALERLLASSESHLHDFLAAQATGDVGGALRAEGIVLTPQTIALLEESARSSHPLASRAARFALERIAGRETPPEDADHSLTLADKMCILKETPFFRNVPVAQLEGLAAAARERRFAKDEALFKAGDLSDSLFVIVEGKVNIAQEKRGVYATLATLGVNSYFGEMSLFDRSARSAAALAAENSLLLELGRDAVFALIVQNSDWALEIINVLSRRIRETSARLAEASRSLPRELHKLFDQFN